MNKFSIAGIALAVVIAGFPLSSALGHEHTMAMKKQHEIMHTFQREWPKASEAAREGRMEEAERRAEVMESSAGNLDGFMLHRNSGRREEFLRMAGGFKELMARFGDYARKGDAESLKKLVPEIEKSCDNCHRAFR